jgi:hypothetical protein
MACSWFGSKEMVSEELLVTVGVTPYETALLQSGAVTEEGTKERARKVWAWRILIGQFRRILQ